jgi:hypothetical protein
MNNAPEYTGRTDNIATSLHCRQEEEGWLWDEIEGAFLEWTRATLQVRYSTKLKNRGSFI